MKEMSIDARIAVNIDFMLHRGVPTIQEGFVPVLKNHLANAKKPYAFVGLDTFGAVNAPKSQGQIYKTDYLAMIGFQQLATEYNIGVLILHHTNKNSENRGNPIAASSGSNGITGAADAVLLLQREDQNAKLIVRSRDGGDSEVTLTRRPCGGWDLAEGQQSVKVSRESTEVLELVEQRGLVNKKEIADALGITIEAAGKRLYRMAKAKVLLRLQDGRYALPEKERAA